MPRLLLALIALAFAHVSAAHSATLLATSATLQAQMAAAKCGDVVQLTSVAPGVGLTKLACAGGAPAILDLSGGALTTLVAYGSSWWTVKGDGHGGGVVGQGAPYNAAHVIGGDHLTFQGLTFTGYGYGVNGVGSGAGIGLSDSTNIVIADNDFHDAAGDAMDVVASQGVTIVRNTCAWLPYGLRVHTDCVQMWNQANDPMTVANVLIDHNDCFGHMQCFDNFGGVGGAMSNIVITNNNAAIDAQWAGELDGPCSGCVMSGNHAATLLGMPTGWVPPGWFLNRVPAPGNTGGAQP